MDLLKELFGGCDELQINKSLFGSEVGHDIALTDHALSSSSSRENLPHPLPIFPDPRPPPAPPSLLRSNSLDELQPAAVPPVSEERDILGLCGRPFSRPQSTFPQLSAAASNAHVDLHHVPPEMPMYLLQEDEGNDEEIMRLLGTSRQSLTLPIGPIPTHMSQTLPTSFHASAVSCSTTLATPTSGVGYSPQYGNGLVGVERSKVLRGVGNENSRAAPFVSGSRQDASMDRRIVSNTRGIHTEGYVAGTPVGQNRPTTQHGQPWKHSDSPVALASGSLCSPRADAVATLEPVHCSQDVLSAASPEHQDILAKATSIIPLEFHQLVTEATNQMLDTTEGQSSASVLDALLSEMGTNIGAILGLSSTKVSGVDTSSSTTRPPLTVGDGVPSSTMASVSREGTSTSGRGLPRSIPVCGVEGTRPRLEPSSNIVSSRRHSFVPSHHQVAMKQQARQARMVNEGTQTSRELSLRRAQTSVSPSVQDSNATDRMRGRHVDAASLDERVTVSQQNRERSPRYQQIRAVRAHSAPTVQPLPSSSSTQLQSPLSSCQLSLNSSPPLTVCAGLPAVTPVSSHTALSGPATSTSAILSLERRVSVASSALQALDALSSVLQSGIKATHQSGVPPASATTVLNQQIPLTSPRSSSTEAGTTLMSSSQHRLATQQTPPALTEAGATSSETRESANTASPESACSSVVSASIVGGQSVQTNHLLVTSQEGSTPHDQQNLTELEGVLDQGLDKLSEESSLSGKDADDRLFLPAKTDTLCVLQADTRLDDRCRLESGRVGENAGCVEESSLTILELEEPPPQVPTLEDIPVVQVEGNVTMGEVGREENAEPANTILPPTSTLTNPPVETNSSSPMEGTPAEQISVRVTVEEQLPGPSDPTRVSPNTSMPGELSSPIAQPTQASSSQVITDSTASTWMPGQGFGGTLAPSISLCFPMVGWSGKSPVVNVSAMPVSLLPPLPCINVGSVVEENGEQPTTQKVKRRHGGGWPKGKRRKLLTEPQPPKPPSTGYALFLAERRPALQQEMGSKSMSILSKTLGKMWSTLPQEKKEEFYARAETDKLRYLEELRKYLTETHKESSGGESEKLDAFLDRSIANEANDDVLMCHLCRVTFTCVHNKRTHYSGKLHADSLLAHLNTLLGNTSIPKKDKPKSKGRLRRGRPTGQIPNDGGVVGGIVKETPTGGPSPQDERDGVSGERERELSTGRSAGDTPQDGVSGERESPTGVPARNSPQDEMEDSLGERNSPVGAAGDSPQNEMEGDSAVREEDEGSLSVSLSTEHLPSLIRDFANKYESLAVELDTQSQRRDELVGVCGDMQQECEELEFMEEGLSRQLESLREDEKLLLEQTLQLTNLVSECTQ